MSLLDIDLKPVMWVALAATAAIVVMRVVEHWARARAVQRTHEALKRALAGPTEE